MTGAVGASGGRPKVAIAGAGVTGLTAAYRLLTREAARDRRPDVSIFEASERLGGSLITVQREHLVIDGGADAFVATKPHAARLCRDLGLGDRLVETRPENRRVYFLKRGKLVGMPEGLVLAVPTRFWPFVRSPLFSRAGIARMGLDLVLPRRRGSGDESISSFLDRRFGREAVEILGEPLLGGIYSGDPARLSIASTFPQLSAMEREHGGLIAGALAARAKRAKPDGGGSAPSAFLALRGGMGELVTALAARVRAEGGQIVTGRALVRVERHAGAFRVVTKDSRGEEQAVVVDRILLACPAQAAARAVDVLAPEAARELRAIPHVSTASINLAFDRAAVPHALDASGVLLPRREGREASAITFMSSKWADRAPSDVALFRVFLGGHARPEVRDMTDDDLVRIARAELAAVLRVDAAPGIVEVFRWNDCRPQPVVGHADRVHRIRDALGAHPGIAVAGAPFDGVGIPDCVKYAEEAADALWDSTEGPL